MIQIPQGHRWNVSNSGVYFGTLTATKNIYLEQDGHLKLAPNAFVWYSTDDDASFGNPVSILTDGTYLYISTADGHTFVIDLSATTFSILETNATNGPTLGNDSDAVIYRQKYVASGGAKVNYVSLGQGQTWTGTSPITDNSTSYPHPLCVFDNRNTLLVGNGNVVRQFSTTTNPFDTEDTTNKLTIPTQYVITGIRYRLSNAYIATRHLYGGEARLFVWNGTGSSAQQGYAVGADWIYSIVGDYMSSVVVITSSGQLLRFNGGGFDELAAFPVYNTPYSWTSSAASTSLVGKVANRGTTVIGDTIYMNIDGSINHPTTTYPGNYLPEQPSGLWIYNPKVGLYHAAGYNYETRLTLTPSEVASSYLVFSTAHQLQTGDAVMAAGVSGLSGITDGQVYYAIPGTTLTTRLALSPMDAVAGRYVSITGTPSTDKFYMSRHESYGQTVINAPGAVYAFAKTNPNPFFGTEVAFGGSTLDETLSAKGILMSLGLGRNRGHFNLPRISSGNIRDFFAKLAFFTQGLDLDTDSFVVKYRTERKSGFPVGVCFSSSATWTSTTTFTIDSTKKDVKSLAIGDEIEVIKGAAGGYTAHITAISGTSGTITFTIDETMPVSSGSFDFIADNWTKIGEYSSSDDLQGAITEKLDKIQAKWVEFRIELRGKGVMIQEIMLDNSPKE